MNQKQQTNKAVKRSFWIAFAFYFLIGFEFFYMISPFAVYFYSVYSPGLDFFNESPALSWLSRIFLPHIVSSTKSSLLNLLPTIGMILAFGGFLIFSLGAAQVYYSKLTKKKAVTGGVYNFVRHPQYGALIISGFGLLILWPRYIALISYITMLFFYYFLARVEEKECESKFGSSYLTYRDRTAMFFPLPIKSIFNIQIFPKKGITRYLAICFSYFIVVLLGIGLADFTRDWSLDNIYALYNNQSATISVIKIEDDQLQKVRDLALENDEVKRRITVGNADKTSLINYVMPLDWSASEIPMRQLTTGTDHFEYFPKKGIETYKIVFTRSIQRGQSKAEGKDIVKHTKQRIPLAEAVVNLKTGLIEDVKGPVENNKLEKIPLPIF